MPANGWVQISLATVVGLAAGVLSMPAQSGSDGRRLTLGANRSFEEPAPASMPGYVMSADTAVATRLPWSKPAEPAAGSQLAEPTDQVMPAMTFAPGAAVVENARHEQTRPDGAVKVEAPPAKVAVNATAKSKHVRVDAPGTMVAVRDQKVRVEAPHTRVAVDEGRVRVRAPFVNLDIRF